MAVKVKVLKAFEQRNGTEEVIDKKTGEKIEKPIIKKFVVGQEIVGPEAEFMLNRHKDKLELLEGVFIPPQGTSPDEIFKQEKVKEDALRVKAKEIAAKKKELNDKIEGKK